jgi:YHS domain-containing protein
MDKKAQWALVGAAWFLALSVAGLGWLAWSHFGRTENSTAGFTTVTNGQVHCPVTGESVQAVSSTPHVSYMGVTYYFSTAADGDGHDARTRFLMDPESFLHPKVAAP